MAATLSSLLQGLMDKQKRVSVGSTESGRQCQVCAVELAGKQIRVPAATTHCVTCNQDLCDECCGPHRTPDGGPHQLRSVLYEQLANDRKLIAERVNRLKDHDRLTDERREELAEQIEEIGKAIIEKRDAIKRQAAETGDILRQEEINTAADRQAEELLKELETVKADSRKKIAAAKEKLGTALLRLESFEAFTKESEDRSSVTNTTVKRLHERATDLLCKSSPEVLEIMLPRVLFVHEEDENLIGNIRTEQEAVVDKEMSANHKASGDVTAYVELNNNSNSAMSRSN